MRFTLFFLALALTIAAPAPAQSRRDRLVADEIGATGAANLHDAVSQLRPRWLRRYSPISLQDPEAGDVVVYLDGTKMGGPDALRQLSVDGVVEVQYLSGPNATTRFGPDHVGGAILVRTR
jgi:hypothetical protein